MNDPPITLVYLYVNTPFSIHPVVEHIGTVLQNPDKFTFCGLLPVELRPQTEGDTL